MGRAILGTASRWEGVFCDLIPDGAPLLEYPKRCGVRCAPLALRGLALGVALAAGCWCSSGCCCSSSPQSLQLCALELDCFPHRGDKALGSRPRADRRGLKGDFSPKSGAAHAAVAPTP